MAAVAHGLDLSADGTQVVSTAQFALPKSGGSQDDAPKFLLRSAAGPTFSAAEQIMSTALPRKSLWGMTTTFIIGENIARRDIGLFLDHLARTSTVREASLLFLAYGSTPHQVLAVKIPLEDTAGVALSKAIRTQESQTGLYSPVSINEFLYKVDSLGVEPVLPQVKIETVDGRERLTLSGLAVFRGRHMVGSLDEQESRGYHLMKASTRGGLFEITLPDQDGFGVERQQLLEIITSQAEVEARLDEGKVSMKITVSAEGNLYELDMPENLASLEMLGQYEQLANESIQRDVSACIDRAQAYQSDILSWGQLLERQRPEIWEALKADWPTQFARIPYEINVDFKLRRTYLQGQSTIEQ